jgi:diaminopimelate epimerase
MKTDFFKYQGTGNDFVIIDNRNGHNLLSPEMIKDLCDRRFGIGADGLMLLNERQATILKWFTTMLMAVKVPCAGTGSLSYKICRKCGIQKELYKFIATDGEHEARIDTNGIVYLKMNDVDVIVNHHSDFLVDTGSPHYVKLIPHLADYDVVKKGREIRYSREFEKEGINVNFVEQLDEPDKIFVRTYERGVENETLSCGTGVTAAALVCYHNENGFNEVEVKTLGGRLNVEFDRIDDGKFRNIWLCGPAERVFNGSIEI